MNFKETHYNLPVNQGKSIYDKDKNISKPEMFFLGAELTQDRENAKVNSNLAKTYFGIKNVSFKAKSDTTKNNYEPIKLFKNKALTKDEAKRLLIDKGFTEEDLKQVDFNNETLMQNLAVLNTYLKYGDVSQSDIDLLKQNTDEAKKLKHELIENFSEPIEEGIAKYFNEQNIEILKKYIDIETDRDLLDMIGGFGNPKFDKAISVVGLLTQNGKHKMPANEFNNLQYLNGEQLDAVTPEVANFVSKINTQVPKDNRIRVGSFCNLGNPEDLTDDIAEKYIKEVNRFCSHKINDYTSFYKNGVKGKIEEMKKISDFLDENPTDFAKDENGLTSSTVIEQFMERPDIKEIMNLLSIMTPEAKQTINVVDFPEPNSEVPFEKWGELFNVISQKDMFGEHNCYSEVLHFIKNNNIKDFDGIIDLIREYKGTYANKNSIYIDRYLNIKDGDYKNAANVLKEVKKALSELPPEEFDNFITYQWKNVISDMNGKSVLENLKKLNQSDIKISSEQDLSHFMHATEPDSFEKMKLLKERGFDTSEYNVVEYIYNNKNLSVKELEDRLNEFDKKLKERYGTETDIEILRYAANSAYSGSIIIGIGKNNIEHGLNDAYINIDLRVKPENKCFYDALWNNENSKLSKKELLSVAQFINKNNAEFAITLCTDKELDFSKDLIFNILHSTNEDNVDFAEKLCKNKELDFPKKLIADVLCRVNKDNKDIAELLCTDKEFDFLPKKHIAIILKNADKYNKEDIKLLKNFSTEFLDSCTDEDIIAICEFSKFSNKENINELKVSEKKDLLQRLVKCNVGMFDISDKIHEKFPLIPRSQEEYCSLLPAIVRSLGIETKELSTEKVEDFNKSLNNLSESLSKLSDSDFANLEITQEYSKDDFIKDVLDKIKDLSPNEQQKVYDYFGFELKENEKSSNGKYSIIGYPINLNKDEKLAQIDNSETKAVIENLSSDVIKFSENNKVHCNNEQLEKLLNEILDVLPELRPMIGKKQHDTHDFDILKHSLKVMQKITQDSKFKKLDDSDKKVMLIAALLHDITKAEGYADKTHAKEGCFDSFFIAKKFNLSKNEEVKLNTLIKNHEWLEYANTAKSDDDLTKRLRYIAYDLYQNNLFDMAEIFTHADLKAVKKDDEFYNSTKGNKRVSYDGKVRSFGESAALYAKDIRKNIEELKKSQPILPTTKLPSASKIAEKITTVNSDGSTNIKGVYKNKDGLVIIKYNEVEDWEAIGLPKGSVSKGIFIPKGTKGDAELNEDVNTGNIKFFVHGLDYSNQLTKFDAFSLVDSDALLSVSYAERPESKYRFFRPQGVILDVDSQYVHGGGNTDAGSGCGKNIAEFKENYIFGGYRESDRQYISNLIKKITGMNDEEYVDFVEKNKNKQMNEIEPAEIRDKIIKAFATINSNTRKGKREYNEMYISNPNKINAVFAYNVDFTENVGNPVDFLNRTTLGEHEKGYNGVGSSPVYERTKFLQEYALKNDLPFVVFGD